MHFGKSVPFTRKRYKAVVVDDCFGEVVQFRILCHYLTMMLEK